jgi:formate dehydrogenase subunit beta
MAKTAKIEVKDQNIVESLNEILKEMLQEGELTGIMVARHLPAHKSVMPALITDPEKIDGSDPLAPAFPMNAAKVQN